MRSSDFEHLRKVSLMHFKIKQALVVYNGVGVGPYRSIEKIGILNSGRISWQHLLNIGLYFDYSFSAMIHGYSLSIDGFTMGRLYYTFVAQSTS